MMAGRPFLLALVVIAIAACARFGIESRTVECRGAALLDCNTILEIGLDAVADGRTEEPRAVVAADVAGSEGSTVAVAVRWRDGTEAWATIAIPTNWPEGDVGAAVRQSARVPDDLVDLLTSSGVESAN